MPIIDQRIMIPAPLEVVWLNVSDPATLQRWNQLATQVSVLNQASGVGQRRRCVDSHGAQRVEEITAWLAPLGCEYKAIDGIYKSYVGRLRLQAVPDGTQLQWTIQYELGGAFGAVRDVFGYQRSLRAEMADSLRALRRLIEASGVRFESTTHAKVTMQADPGFEARQARAGGSASTAASRLSDITRAAQSTPLTPLAIPVDLSDPDLDLPSIEAVQPQPVPPTPPPAEADYRRPPTSPPAPIGIVEPPVADEDTRQTAARRARSMAAPLPELAADQPQPPAPTPLTASVPARDDRTPPRGSRQNDDLPSTIIARRDPQPAPPPPLAEASDSSVWDVFGVTRPSQRPREELDSLITDLRTPPPAKAISVVRSFDRPVPVSTPPVPPIVLSPPAPIAEPVLRTSVPESSSSNKPPIAAFGKATVRVRRIGQDSANPTTKAVVRVRRPRSI